MPRCCRCVFSRTVNNSPLVCVTGHGQRKTQSLHKSRGFPGSPKRDAWGAGRAGSCHPSLQWVTEAEAWQQGWDTCTGRASGKHTQAQMATIQTSAIKALEGLAPARLYHKKSHRVLGAVGSQPASAIANRKEGELPVLGALLTLPGWVRRTRTKAG